MFFDLILVFQIFQMLLRRCRSRGRKFFFKAVRLSDFRSYACTIPFVFSLTYTHAGAGKFLRVLQFFFVVNQVLGFCSIIVPSDFQYVGSWDESIDCVAQLAVRSLAGQN